MMGGSQCNRLAQRTWRRRLLLLLLLPISGRCGAEAATIEELRAASEDLQEGVLDEQGLEIFREHAVSHPADWRVHGMLGQALALKGAPGAVDALRTAHRLAPQVGQVAFSLASELSKSTESSHASEASTLYRKALKLAPALGNADTYVQLGRALARSEGAAEAAKSADEGNAGATKAAIDDDDEAIAAWAVAAALAPERADVHLLLASRLARGGAELRKGAVRAASTAVRLTPTSAGAYDVLGAALLTGRDVSSLPHKVRQRLEAALRAAIALRHNPPAADDPSETRAAATAHDRLARSLLSQLPLPAEGGEKGREEGAKESAGEDGNQGGGPAVADIDDMTTAAMAEIVAHVRAAAKLDPARFGGRAHQLEGWEDALRQHRRADHLDTLQREEMVKAIHAPHEQRQLEEEEDREIAAEAATRAEPSHRSRRPVSTASPAKDEV